MNIDNLLFKYHPNAKMQSQQHLAAQSPLKSANYTTYEEQICAFK